MFFTATNCLVHWLDWLVFAAFNKMMHTFSVSPHRSFIFENLNCSILRKIEQEIIGCLDFLNEVYGIFGFEFELNLSTRPEKYLGDVEVWNQYVLDTFHIFSWPSRAEASLEKALNSCGRPWQLNPGDGAFYGPKIDIKVTDALKRKHQVKCSLTFRRVFMF